MHFMQLWPMCPGQHMLIRKVYDDNTGAWLGIETIDIWTHFEYNAIKIPAGTYSVE